MNEINKTKDEKEQKTKRRGRKPVKVEMTDYQEKMLMQIRQSTKASQAHVMRAEIIMRAYADESNLQIAQEMVCDRGTVIKWRKRWSESQSRLQDAEENVTEGGYRKLIEATLSDAERSGRPNTFTAEQLCQIIAVAVQKPEEYGCPVTHWTPYELTQIVIKEGIVNSISPRHIGRFLKGMRLETPSVTILAE